MRRFFQQTICCKINDFFCRANALLLVVTKFPQSIKYLIYLNVPQNQSAANDTKTCVSLACERVKMYSHSHNTTFLGSNGVHESETLIWEVYREKRIEQTGCCKSFSVSVEPKASSQFTIAVCYGRNSLEAEFATRLLCSSINVKKPIL